MARSRSIPHKLRSLSRVGVGRQALVIEAVLGMAAARIAILFRPFAMVSTTIGSFVPPDDPRVRDRPLATPEQARTARRIGWAIRAVAPFMPFRSLCLQQAMAGHRMLRRRGIASVMHFGAARNPGQPLDAHAWLEAGGVQVTGYPVAANMTELGCLV